jgi:hypothetical protein
MPLIGPIGPIGHCRIRAEFIEHALDSLVGRDAEGGRGADRTAAGGDQHPWRAADAR